MANKKINWGEELKTASKVGLHGVGKFLQIFANILITILLVCVLTGILVVCAFSVYISNYVDTEIDADLFRIDISTSTTTHIYRYEFTDRTNRVGTTVPMDSAADAQLQGEADQTFVSIDKMPDNMVNAVIAIEDKRFMTHGGVDWKRTVAAGANFFLGFDESGYGGSSITQQLIKNVTGNDDYSIQRKIQEIFWALDLETKMDKEEIIELYLNIVNFGNGAYGVQAAAYNYFSKDVSELTLIECAAIACITKNPSRFNPITYPENNQYRRDYVLYEMYDQGFITYREFEEAYEKELVLNVPGANESEEEKNENKDINSWYIDMVIEDVIDDLVEKYDYSEKMAALLVYNGGFNIYTLVDPEIQKILEEEFLDDGNFPEDKSGIKAQCSAIVIDPYTGDVLGVVGARGEKTANRLQNFATMTKRPPGSAIKPLAVYSPAFEQGILTWSRVIDDTPHSYIGGVAWPKNSTNTYRGLINVSYALKVSTNTTAVKLLEEVGLKNAFDFCHDTLGMTSMIEYGQLSDGTGYTDIGLASLALGQLNYGVTVREISAAYSMFVNSGIYSKPNSYLKVTDSVGNVVLENVYEGTVAISEETASLMTMLLESVPRSGGTAAALTFDSEYDIDVAGKTGSAGDYYDRWFIGYTPYYICGVWYGYEYPKSISAASNPCVKVWDAVMSRVHDDKVIANMKEGDKYLEFNVSNNLVECTYCMDSGLLMSEACSHDPRGNRAETGWFVKGTEPTEYCQTHIMVDYDFVEKAIACEWCPPENIKQVALLDVERRFEKQVAVVDAQYVYMELPFDVLPYQTVYRPYFYNLGNGEYYCGYTYGPVHYNRTCSAHFDKNAWQDKVAGILAGETTAAETTLTTPPEDQRRRLDEILGGQ